MLRKLKYTQSIHKYTRFLTKLGKICPFFCEPTPEKCKQRHYSEDMDVNIIIQKPKAWDKKHTGMADKQEGTSRERCPISLVKMSHIFEQDVLYLTRKKADTLWGVSAFFVNGLWLAFTCGGREPSQVHDSARCPLP